MEFEEHKIYHVKIRDEVMYAKYLMFFDGNLYFYANDRRYIIDKQGVDIVKERY